MFAPKPLLMVLMLAGFCASSPAQAAQSNSSVTDEPGYLPYLQLQISHTNRATGVTSNGTFTRPKSGGPFPAVLLIPGSGPQDRDETIAGHKPFRVLADYLTRHGIAVLRMDDRGIGASTGDFSKATTHDLALDAEASMRFLLARPDVDPKRTGLIGHGEGAIIAPMVANEIPQIALVVLLAAPAVPGEQVLLAQRERAERAAHMPPAQIALDHKIATMVYDMVRDGKKEREIERALSKQPDLKGQLASLWETQLPRLEAPWLRFFLGYDPAPALGKVKCPVLALQGEKDMEVAPDQNVPALKAALAQGGNPDVTVKVLPGLNYYFQTAETGLPIEYPAITESISPAVLDVIGTWIADHTS